MPRYIMKLHDDKTNQDLYFEWSTVVDAPVTYGMPLEKFKEYYQHRYGTQGMEELPQRLERVEKTGISAYAPFDDFENYFSCNRAGDNETTATKAEILEALKNNTTESKSGTLET